MKKTLFIGLLVSVTMLLFGMSASALTEGDWEFKLLDDQAVITDYLGDGGDVVIPSTILVRRL